MVHGALCLHGSLPIFTTESAVTELKRAKNLWAQLGLLIWSRSGNFKTDREQLSRETAIDSPGRRCAFAYPPRPQKAKPLEKETHACLHCIHP